MKRLNAWKFTFKLYSLKNRSETCPVDDRLNPPFPYGDSWSRRELLRAAEAHWFYWRAPCPGL
jgi:hypothetical protein